MKVAVVTPYFNTRPEWLRQCHESVMAQTFPCTHILVADGRPLDMVDKFAAQHVRLSVNCDDYGNTPRGIGSVLAVSQGFDAIAYLDADNWFYPEHIATMVELQQNSGASVVTSARNLHRLDGSLLGLCPHVDGNSFIDTSCFFLTRTAFILLPVWWCIPSHLHAIGDRVLWGNVQYLKLSHAHSTSVTVAYRTAFIEHYQKFNETPPEGAKSWHSLVEVLNRARHEAQERAAQNQNHPTAEQ